MPVHFDGKEFTGPAGNTLALKDAVEWSDFARAHGVDNAIPDDVLAQNVPRALALLTAAYAALGVDALVTSFWRGPILNARVGGKVQPPSAHMDGRAVDSIPAGMTVQLAFQKLSALASVLNYDQLIIEHDNNGSIWLHLSVPKEGVAPRRMAFSLAKQITDRQHAG